jgi:inner membrane protein
MDPITHGLFGAAAAQLRAKPYQIGIAALCGILAGIAPDLDVLIRSSENPLLQIQYHRHFTHALIFVPFGSALIAGILWPFLKRKSTFYELFIYCAAGMLMHGIVDATTSYGTHLFWPFTNRRESWSIMSIIDPIVTIPLLFGVILYLRKRQKSYLTFPLIFVLCYFAFGALQYSRVKESMYALAKQRGHTIEHHEVKPTLFNSILWRSTYIAKDRIYIDGIRSNIFGQIDYYLGSSAPLFKREKLYPNLKPDTVLAKDIDKFMFFSDGFVALKPDEATVIADMRYAMLPHEIKPLWGIRINIANPDKHVIFESYRQRDATTVSTFVKQLKGESLK